MRIIAWWVGRLWSRWHILSFGAPLCGTPIPDVTRAKLDRAMRPTDWQHTCEKCRVIAVRAATTPIDVAADRPTKAHLQLLGRTA